MQTSKKKLQNSRLPRIYKTSESIMRHLVTTRATGNEGMNNEERVVIHEDLSVVEYCKGNGHIGSREFIREYRRDLQVDQVII